MHYKVISLALTVCLSMAVMAQTNNLNNRALWASINDKKDASLGDYQQHTGKVLVTWRMLPGDDATTGFDLYRAIGTAAEKKIATNIRNRTCFQDTSASKTADNHYRLTYSGSDETLSMFTLTKAQVSGGLPYVSIPLADTKDVYADTKKIVYTANDASVGDLDGDGEFEIVVKRLQSVKDASGNIVSDGSGASYSQQDCLWAVIWDAYKLDGTLLWRVKGGPGIILGNSSSFAIADFDGDGCAEMAIRTCEGTVFGDGTEIPDVNGDGKIDYRTWGNLNSSSPGWVDHYSSAGPEFISIVDGKTGRELARDNFIARETSSAWGDDYWKRACSFRIGVGCFDKSGLPSVVIGRGVYARSVIEAWDWRDGQLTKRWRFDTSDKGTGKDGKKHSTYAAQGNHSLNVADLDGDGLDEVMYGSMAVDDDGIGLWNTRLGHGDANHVGKFLPEREGLQMFHCLETGKTMVALHDARDGSTAPSSGRRTLPATTTWAAASWATSSPNIPAASSSTIRATTSGRTVPKPLLTPRGRKAAAAWPCGSTATCRVSSSRTTSSTVRSTVARSPCTATARRSSTAPSRTPRGMATSSATGARRSSCPTPPGCRTSRSSLPGTPQRISSRG